MDVPKILQFVDEAVYAKTDKHLNDLQRRIIAGILKRQKYADVSETYGYSAQHVKKVSHELLQMLSDVFGEPVKKSNLESVLERHINVNITFGTKNTRHKNIIAIGSINDCATPSTATPEKSEPETRDRPQQPQNQTQVKTIDKLRKFGLSDEQIAEVLEIPLDAIDWVDLDE
jgi:hypothetical protein